MVSIKARNKSDSVLVRSHSHDSALGGTDAMLDTKAEGVNKKLMRLAVDSRHGTKRQSLMFDESGAAPSKTEIIFISTSSDDLLPCRRMKHKRPDTYGDEEESARFPRMEAMSHFHYSTVDFDEKITVSFLQLDNDTTSLDTGQSLLVQVSSKDKSWIIKRSQEDFVGLDRQIHRCLYDRRYSNLPELKDCEEGTPLDDEMVQEMQYYLNHFTELTGNNLNCGPILNWLELDNHGGHLVVMEADDSAINVPAVAAGRAIKRYQAQAPDEMSLEVGDFLSVIDMPPSEETIWWRGKKGFEVGFFPSHCIEILGEKDINEQILTQLQARPVSKRRGKFISFLRFFFKSRPSKDELMQSGILRERVFGCDLGERLAFTGHDIPIVLEMCAAVVEEHGVVDGIYRLSGIVSNLQKLRVAFDCDEQLPNLCDTKYLNDIHCISSLLKTYFRELPNPLFTYELYDKFVIAINKDDDTERTVAFHHVIQRLPPPHYRTMNYLLRHLNFCASKAGETNMTAKNLAIVWAPNLLRPNSDDSVAALTEFRTQAIIVEYMIRNVDVFFDKNLASAAIAYYPEVQDVPIETDNECARLVSQNNGPKLITLEEARQRVNKQRIVNENTAVEGHSNSPRHNKLKTTYTPPKVSATPISPSPTLLSIEEAQARTKHKHELLPPGQKNISESRDPSDVNSPRRSRKWFGLFQKSSKTNIAAEDDQFKSGVTYYTKKPNPVTYTPSRSQSEYRLQDLQKRQEQDKVNVFRAESYGSTPSVENKSYKGSLTSLNAPYATPELDLDLDFSDNEGDSLMSAIVSVTAKYIDVEDPLRYHTPRRSFTIGSASEFRKLNDSELNVEPPSDIQDNNNTIEREKVALVDVIPGVPYSSHRAAPSIDSGYLSQGSTLNRLKDLDTAENSNSSNSPERKQIRASGRIASESEDVPYKRIRSLSPENSKVPESPVSVTKPKTRKFSRSEFYKNKSSSPESRTRSYSEVSQKDCSAQTPTTPKQPPGHSYSDYKVTNMRKTSYEPMLTSPRVTSFNAENKLYDTNNTTVETKDDIYNQDRPNTLSLTRNSGASGFDLTPGSDRNSFKTDIRIINKVDTFTGLRRVEYVGKTKSNGFSPPITKSPEGLKTLSSPLEKTPNNRKSFPFSSDSSNYKTAGTPLERSPKRLSGEFTLSEYDEEDKGTSSGVLTKESVQWRYVADNETPERTTTSTRRQSAGNLVKVPSTYVERDGSIATSPSSPTESISARRRSSVLDVARMFDGKTDTSNISKTSKNRPISNPIPSKLWTSNRSTKRSEQTKSSPNLYNRNECSTERQQQKTGENVNPLFYAVNKSTDRIDHSKSSSPSYKDFDLRCRVKDGLVNQLENSATSDKQFSGSPHNSRSNERLGRSNIGKTQPSRSAIKTRPQSEIIQGFNFQAINNEVKEKEIPIKASRSVYSISPRNQPVYTKPMQASKSENKLSYDCQDGGRQIGNFPLTLKCGSAQNSRTSFEGDQLNRRPVSMYDNSRASYYDNVNSIRYEML